MYDLKPVADLITLRKLYAFLAERQDINFYYRICLFDHISLHSLPALLTMRK